MKKGEIGAPKDTADEKIDFSKGFPLMVIIAATGERAQIIEYIPAHPPRYRVKNERGKIKELEDSEIELADKTPPVPAKKERKPLHPALEAKIRKLLLKKRLEVEKRFWYLERKQRPMEEADQSISSDHPAEVCTDTDSSYLKQSKRNLKRRLWKIGLALISLDHGIYGLCRVCGDQILLSRLQKVPETSICVSCKEEEANNPNSHHHRRKNSRR